MKKVLLLSCFFISVGFNLTSCNNDPETPAENTMDLEGYVPFDMSGSGLNITLMVPGKGKTGVEPSSATHENQLTYTVNAGPYFSLVFQDEEPDLELFKTDLSGDLTFSNTIISEKEGVIVYRSKAKDIDRFYYHFRMVKEIDGMQYVVYDNKFGEYTEEHIEEMIKSISTIQVQQPL